MTPVEIGSLGLAAMALLIFTGIPIGIAMAVVGFVGFLMLSGFQAAVVDVLVAKALRALDATGLSTLVVAGGVGANRALRERLRDALDARGGRVHFPEPRYCTDNGAMIAMAAALRLGDATRDYAFGVAPRWELRDVTQARATIADNTDLR